MLFVRRPLYVVLISWPANILSEAYTELCVRFFFVQNALKKCKGSVIKQYF